MTPHELYEQMCPGGFPRYVDDSFLSTYAACAHKGKFAYIEHWKSQNESDHLIFGGAYAHGLEVGRRAFYERSVDQDGAIAEAVREGLKSYGTHAFKDDRKSPQRLVDAFVHYGIRYPFAEDEYRPAMRGGKASVEFSFAIPLPINHPVTGEPILYVGRSDMLSENRNELLFIHDDKTTTQLGATWPNQWNIRSQFTGYYWAAQEHGLDVRGVVVRGLCCYVDRVDSIQTVTYRPRHVVDKWYANMLLRVRQAIESFTTDEWAYSFGDACTSYGGCPFQTICLSEDEPKWLQMEFVRRMWDPVSRQSIPL